MGLIAKRDDLYRSTAPEIARAAEMENLPVGVVYR